jgi:glycosyltransferase involved in cell wall biosynthesis
MKIIHLLSPATAGGLERVVQGLSIGQQARGDQVIVAAVVHEPMTSHPFLVPLQRAGIEVRQVLVPHRGYLAERQAIAALCREFGPDVVHSHGYRPDVVDGSAVRKAGVATVSSYHGATRGSWRNRLYENLHFRFLRSFDAVIAVSGPIGEMLAGTGVHTERIHVVPNAWSEIAAPLSREAARATLDLPADARVLGWIGRLSPEKGIDVFVDAVAALNDPSITACVIGDGPERTASEARAAAAGVVVRWCGMLPEAGRLCTAFDVFVLSSRTEGIPISLLEAIAAGIPVVATRVGGVPDVVSENEAWLVPSEQPAVLAEAIRVALADRKDAAHRTACASARLASEFGRDAWLDKHEEVYAIAQTVRRRAMQGMRRR